MLFNKTQSLVIVAAFLLLIGLYFLPSRVPFVKEGQAAAAQDSIPLNGEAIILEARKSLDSNQLKQLSALETRKAQAPNIKEEIAVYQEFSKQWNDWGNFAAGGFYAEKVAELQSTGEAWSIAGTTYGIAFRKATDERIQKFAGKTAIKCFEQAAKIEPDSVRHRINEATMYVDLSGVDRTIPPMTGAQKLLELDKAFPQNTTINFALANLSINRSGDFGKAAKRLETILTFPNLQTRDKIEAHYLLTECYKQLNQKDKVLLHFDEAIAAANDEKEIRAQLQRAKAAYVQQ